MDSNYHNLKNYYLLKIYLDNSILSEETVSKYRVKVLEIQEKIKKFKVNLWDVELGLNNHIDAGFDVFNPNNINILANSYSNHISNGIRCSMSFNNRATAFYLYPRSSMGSKTPLRLSNSVGIIDSGYRGDIGGLFDNISDKDYKIKINDRLLQICGPNIMYPIYPVIVDDISELGVTERGDGGFGSTGR